MPMVEDYDPLNKELPYCVVDLASDEEKKKGIHDIRIYETYPAFPWKFDKDIDHSGDNHKFFYQAVKNAGLVKHIRAEDKRQIEPPITYLEWLRRNQDKEGFINHLEEMLNGKRQTSED